MTPFDDFAYLINHVLLGDEPTIEDFILLVGTLVAFIAFILWCCFPIQPKDTTNHRQFSCKSIQNSLESAQAHLILKMITISRILRQVVVAVSAETLLAVTPLL